MKVRPILFSTPMVRALLDGRKSQTRRVINPQPEIDGGWEGSPEWALFWKVNEDGLAPDELARLCPYGKHGDLLWVRETAEADEDACESVILAKYTADGAPVLYPGPAEDEHGEPDYGGSHAHWWYSKTACPSIHLPRRFSRLTLEITGVRVERLQDISDADAMAEGLLASEAPNGHVTYGVPGLLCGQSPPRAYRLVWESINGPGSWDANPWVWVLEFKFHRSNVDELLKAMAA